MVGQEVNFKKKINKKYPDLDPRYIFYNSGFNLRPLDIQASLAHSQFKRLDQICKNRSINKKNIIKKIVKDKRWKNQFSFVNVPDKIKPSYMVFPILLNGMYKNKKMKFINFLEKKGIETRPIISGSFINQPSVDLYKLNKNKRVFKGAQIIQDLGFVIGLHTKIIQKKKIDKLVDCLFGIENI